MTSGSLNLPEDRTPSVLDRDTIWKMVKRSNGLVTDSPDQPNMDQEVDEKLTDEVRTSNPRILPKWPKPSFKYKETGTRLA